MIEKREEDDEKRSSKDRESIDLSIPSEKK